MQLFVLCSCPYRTLGGCMLGYPGRCPGLIVDGLSARQPRCRSSVSSLSIIRSNFARWLTNQAFVLQTLVSNITLQSANRASRSKFPTTSPAKPIDFHGKIQKFNSGKSCRKWGSKPRKRGFRHGLWGFWEDRTIAICPTVGFLHHRSIANSSKPSSCFIES